MLAKKGVLISDPSVERMNETRWRFELESLKMAEDERFDELKDILEAFRRSLISVLGLDLMPIRQEDGLLRRAKSEDFTPLVIAAGRDEWLKDLGEKMEELFAQEDVQKEMENPPPGMVNSLEDLEELERIEKEAGGDIDFPEDPEELRKFLIWNSPQSKQVRESMVLTEEEADAQAKAMMEAEEATPRDRRVVIDKDGRG